MDNHKLTLTELLDDPMTRAVMVADRVDAVALRASLSAVARRLQQDPPAYQRRICVRPEQPTMVVNFICGPRQEFRLLGSD
jgi:hypothetical protein